MLDVKARYALPGSRKRLVFRFRVDLVVAVVVLAASLALWLLAGGWWWTLVAVVASAGIVVDLLVLHQLTGRWPVMWRLAALRDASDTARLVVTAVIPAEAAMARAQLVVQCGAGGKNDLVVFVPGSAPSVHYLLARADVPGWLVAADPGYRFHAKVSLALLEDGGDGFISVLEEGEQEWSCSSQDRHDSHRRTPESGRYAGQRVWCAGGR